MRLILCFVLLFTLNFESSAQPNPSHFILDSKNSYTIDSLLNDSSEKFIFFCPTFNFSPRDYDKRIKQIRNEIESNNLSSVPIFFLFFKNHPVNPSKDILLSSDDPSETFAISELGIYYLAEETQRIERASSILKQDFSLSRKFRDKPLYHVDLIIKSCYENLPDHIPAYAPFIIETVSPNYSDKERIQHLSDSLQLAQTKILVLENNIVSLSASMNCLEEKIDRATYLMDTIHYAEIKNIEGEYYLAPGGMYEPPVIERKIKHFPAKIAAFLSPFLAMTLILISR